MKIQNSLLKLFPMIRRGRQYGSKRPFLSFLRITQKRREEKTKTNFSKFLICYTNQYFLNFMFHTTSPKNLILVFKIEPEYWQDQPYLKATQVDVSNSDSKWALSGVVYEYAWPKSYLGLRDLLGVGLQYHPLKSNLFHSYLLLGQTYITNWANESMNMEKADYFVIMQIHHKRKPVLVT